MTDDFVAGNFEDKYNATNPISKILMTNFLSTFKELLQEIKNSRRISRVCEVGCGDGEILLLLHQYFPEAEMFATDLSQKELDKAKKKTDGIDINFSQQNIENMSEYQDQQFDLIVCVEVLEHVEHPSIALKELKRVSNGLLIVSVPSEPLWRVLNIVRGKYIADLGNTPGHLNHWNPISFERFILQDFLIIESKYPLPWQMKLIK